MYYYGMRLRPFGIGCQPKDCVYRVEGVVAEGYWDIIAYERKLSEDEMYQYDLDDVTNVGWALTANGSFQPESEYDNLIDALYVRTEWEAFDKEHGYVSNDVKQMDIADELEVYYDMIDCRCIDIVTRKIGKEWYDIVCDDEGLLAGKYPTALDATGMPMLVGNLIICRHDGADLAGLTDEDVANIIKHSGYYYKDGEKQWCIVNMSF